MVDNMKIIAFYNAYESLNNDVMFEEINTTIGDNLLEPFVELKKYASFQNIRICSADTNDLNLVDAFVFCEMPKRNNKYLTYAKEKNIPIYLIILENIFIKPENDDKIRHLEFTKVFTYVDSWLNDSRYIKLNYSFKIPETINLDLDHKIKLVTMISSGGKYLSHKDELYTEREKAISWFENHHRADFDFYGTGWDLYQFKGPKIIRTLNRLKPLRKLLAKDYPTYKGSVERKKPILEKYFFAICYENTKNLPGYITEKIFDCFFAGCVPIFWGANNITDYIPVECFIDKRKFETYDSLYNFISNLRKEDYLKYLEAIEKFLKSNKIKQFSIENFINTVSSNIF
jgi:hypothetical protein